MADALNMDTDEVFQNSIEAIIKMKGENPEAAPYVVRTGNPIGVVKKGPSEDDLKGAFGLK